MNLPVRIQTPSCPHYKQCSGCSADLSLSPPPLWQDILDFFKDTSIPNLYQGPTTQWRCRAKLAVRGSTQKPIIGLFKRHSHEAVSIPLCLVHHPKINQAVRLIECWMSQHHLTPYQERSLEGDLRYLQLVVERSTGRVQVCFVLNFNDFSSSQAKKWQDLLVELFKEHKNFWHSIWVNFNNRATNTIFGEKWICLEGDPYLWETFGPVEVCYQPANFAQANLDLFEILLQQVFAWVPDQAKVVEYYAGVGAIGLFIASKCAWVKCEEINPFAQDCFLLSKAKLPLDIACKLSFYPGSAESRLGLMQEADVVIVDPPRKGLGQVFLQALSHSSVNTLIYVSCGWESFKLDYQRLLLDGWNLKELDGYAFFPGSNHVELLACFERKDLSCAN